MYRVPKHIGIIPDGNRRWARLHGINKEDGYDYGLEPGLKLLRLAKKYGINEIFLVNYGWEWDMKNNWASRNISRIDLVIRWGGMRRLSGLLPLQTVYADICVIDDLWPDFRKEQFIEALEWYQKQDVTFTNSTVEFGSSAKYIKLEGFIFKDYTPNDDWGACISLSGGASNIQIRNNEISNIKCRGTGEVGVNCIVLTGDSSSSINNVTIENNYVYNCNTGWSEAITTDGNVENCVIKNNTVDNTGNIGIDLCGNFSWTGTVGSDTNQSRNILVTKNKVMNCNSAYATSAGLYCDGGRDNTFSYNIVYNSQCGIELGAEEKGADVKNFTVNNNIIVNCGRAIGAGAYLSTGAKHYNTNVYDNTIICNETSKWGENYAIYLERTTGFTFKNNVVYAKTSKTSFIETSGSATYTLSGNTWYVEGGKGSKPSADSTGVFKNPNISGLDNMLKGIF